MKIQTLIDIVGGRYQGQISTMGFTAAEEALLKEMGEPTINIGGAFTGTVSRPGQSNTVVNSSGGGGSGLTTQVVVDINGVVVAVNIVSGGSGYESAPTLTVVGDGTGATANATVVGGAVTGITVTAGGLGYHLTPVTVSFTLPDRYRLIRTDFPIKEVFDLADDLNADAMIKVWSDTIVSRLTTAKADLLIRQAAYVGETITTV